LKLISACKVGMQAHLSLRNRLLLMVTAPRV
jgi:hypothetical protein